VTDRQTDGRAIAYTRYSIYAVVRKKLLILPTPPLFDALLRLNPVEFLDETYPAETRGMGLPYGGNFTILTSTVFL